MPSQVFFLFLVAQVISSWQLGLLYPNSLDSNKRINLLIEALEQELH